MDGHILNAVIYRHGRTGEDDIQTLLPMAVLHLQPA
jgi:hypothetical protein